MICERWHDRLLEADLAELDPTASSPLAEHLRTCPACAAFARRILAQHEHLRDALDEVERPYTNPRRRAAGPRRAAMLALLPLAAAVAALLLVPTGPRGVAPLDPPPEAVFAAIEPPQPAVRTPPGMRAAVIRTDQRLTLVLLYEEETLR